MILAWAIVIGLFAGGMRAWWSDQTYYPMPLRWGGMAVVASLPQMVVFKLVTPLNGLNDDAVGMILVGSQAFLLLFVLLNVSRPGFKLFAVGLFLNLLVIALNGGLMPITPELANLVHPFMSPDDWAIGERLGNGKDIVLAVENTTLWGLSDRFFLSLFGLYRVAYSIGDILIAVGVIQYLWAAGHNTPYATGQQLKPALQTSH